MLISEMPEFRTREKVLTTGPDAKVRDAAREMTNRNYGAIVVTDASGKLAGIVTERDLMTKVVAKGVDPDSTPVSAIMTAAVRTAREDDEVADCLDAMSEGRFRHLPVVDAEGQPVGMVSQRDFVALSWGDIASRAHVKTRAMFGRGYQGAMIAAAILIFAAAVTVGT
jgi:CBS domain-containing protein